MGKPEGLGILPPALSRMQGPQPCCSLTQHPLFAQALHNQMITAVQEISNLIEPVAAAARAEASQLGHKVMRVWSCSRGTWCLGRRGTKQLGLEAAGADTVLP